MKQSLMTKMNWIVVISGILITYFGFFLVSFITTNYDGMFAFISIATIVLGLIVVVLGLSLGFQDKSKTEA